MREFQKIIYFCFIDYARAFDYVDHNKILAVSSRDENSWKVLKILQEMGMPDHLTCLLRNMYAGQEAAVRAGHGTTDWFQKGKGVKQTNKQKTKRERSMSRLNSVTLLI